MLVIQTFEKLYRDIALDLIDRCDELTTERDHNYYKDYREYSYKIRASGALKFSVRVKVKLKSNEVTDYTLVHSDNYYHELVTKLLSKKIIAIDN